MKKVIRKTRQNNNSFNQHFFTRNRENLIKKMPLNSLALLGNNYPLHTNGDGVLPYVSNNDLWYFTGVEQDETVLLLIKTEKEVGEILFILPSDPDSVIWNGKFLDPEEASVISGVENVMLTTQWDTVKSYIYRVKTLFLNLQEHERASFYRNRNHDIYDYCKKYFPLHHYDRLAPLIYHLRMTKYPVEVEAIRQATAITKEALESAFSLMEAGRSEKDIEAVMTAVYIKNHATAAFLPIVASGSNSCTLHYITNHEKLNSKEVLLIDSGARLNQYSADITRVFPIHSNKYKENKARGSRVSEFTPRQYQVYEAVLRVLKQATALVKCGIKISDYQKKTVDLIKTELRKLGLLTKKDLIYDPMVYRKYFMHGVSHWLGLDIHDVGGYDKSFMVGQVLTCEPGIYIPEEGIGVRLENNLWIKSTKQTVNLSASIPIEIEEVYQWINSTIN